MLQDVLYVPKLHRNLLSVPQISKQGIEVRFQGDHCWILCNPDTLIGEGRLQDNLYLLSADTAHTFPSTDNNSSESGLTAKTSSRGHSQNPPPVTHHSTWHHRPTLPASDSVKQAINTGKVHGTKIQRGHLPSSDAAVKTSSGGQQNAIAMTSSRGLLPNTITTTSPIAKHTTWYHHLTHLAANSTIETVKKAMVRSTNIQGGNSPAERPWPTLINSRLRTHNIVLNEGGVAPLIKQVIITHNENSRPIVTGGTCNVQPSKPSSSSNPMALTKAHTYNLHKKYVIAPNSNKNNQHTPSKCLNPQRALARSQLHSRIPSSDSQLGK